MTGLVLTDEVVLPERDVILEEHNQRIDNNPRARLGEQIDAALYLNHPYGKPIIGWRHEMEELTRDDAIAFYRRFYGPNNAMVVVAGDVDAERCAEARGRNLRQGRTPPRPAAATSAAGAAAGRAALAHARRSARRAADAAARLSRAVLRHRQARRIRSARGAGAHAWARAPTAGSTATLVVDKTRRRRRRRLVRRHRARSDQVRRLRRAAARRRRLPQLEHEIDARHRRVDRRQGCRPPRSSSAPRRG